MIICLNWNPFKIFLAGIGSHGPFEQRVADPGPLIEGKSDVFF
jgi:hypothetical protein